MMKVTKQEILDIRKRLKEINLCPLEHIETDFEIPEETIKEWKFTGLNNFDLFLFVITGGSFEDSEEI